MILFAIFEKPCIVSLDITVFKCYNFVKNNEGGDTIKEIKYVVSGLSSPILLREFLARSGLSKTLIKKAKPEGLFVNGERVTVRKSLNNGDVVEVKPPKEISESIPAMDIPLKVIYEDDYIIAVDKPKNMPTHPSKGNNLPTLANAVMSHFDGDFVFRAINRLDRDTSGIVIIAKDAVSANNLSASMKTGKFSKKYLCITDGIPYPEEGTIDAPIRRLEENNIKRIVADDGKRAITKYRVVEKLAAGALCEITLLTGRTHQIRVHMAHIGTPLFGDFLYGKCGDENYFLRCIEITFPNPHTHENLTIFADK